jgi:hypothetical protein
MVNRLEKEVQHYWAGNYRADLPGLIRKGCNDACTLANFCLSSRFYTLNELPQPQVLFTFGLLNLKPAPSSVSM